MQSTILIALVVYVSLMLAITVYFHLHVKQTADYLMAGRGLPWYVLVGTGIGTGVVIGASGVAYQHGWAGSAYPLGLGLGTVATAVLFAKMRHFEFMTLGEELASYYSNSRLVVEFSNISLFASQICWVTVQIMGAGAVLSVVTGLAPFWCIIGAGIVTACISIPGGLKTVTYTDSLQAIILIVGLSCLTYSALHHSGGIGGLRVQVPPDYFSFLGVRSFGAREVINLIVVLALSVIADPGRRLHLYSARSVQGARWSMVISGLITMTFALVIAIIGMYAFTLNPALPARDQAVPWLIVNVLPPWLAAFVVISIASAALSSANTNAITAGTFFVRHIYPLVTGGKAVKRPVRATQTLLLCAFILSTAAAVKAGTVTGFVLTFLPLTTSGLAVIILVGYFWRRATPQGALAALLVTPLLALVIMFVPDATRAFKSPTLVATLGGFVAHVVVSLLTPRQTRTFEQTAELLSHQRKAALGNTDPEHVAALAVA
jgi:SSS family solute:Na+ symporter